MRLEGQAKAGFYPTPERVTELIASCLKRDAGERYLADLCCGEGIALGQLGAALGAHVIGVELSEERHTAASVHMDELTEQSAIKSSSVMHGNALNAMFEADAGRLGFLYANPPYDHAGDKERLEEVFLLAHKDFLAPGGVLAFVVSETYMERWARIVTPYFENVSVWRFPEAEYKAFKQVVIFGTRRAETGFRGKLNEPQTLSEGCCTYTVPSTKEPYIYLSHRDPAELYELATHSHLWGEVLADLAHVTDAADFRPLLPLKNGHLSLVIMSGAMNEGAVVESQGRRFLIKGTAVKSPQVSVEDYGEQGSKKTVRDTFKTTVSALDLASADLITVGELEREAGEALGEAA